MVPRLVPLSCPACFGSALLPEAELLRLPDAVLFPCPHCQGVVAVADRGSSRAEGA
jgi:hypothetical protein